MAIVHTDIDGDPVDRIEYTFEVDIGPEADNRHVMVGIVTFASNISAVTFNESPAVQHVYIRPGPFGHTAAIYGLDMSEGTTATVVVTLDATSFAMSIAVATVIGMNPVAHDTAAFNESVNGQAAEISPSTSPRVARTSTSFVVRDTISAARMAAPPHTIRWHGGTQRTSSTSPKSAELHSIPRT